MAKYSIKELENLSGIKAHTIRIWEKRYGLVKPGRTDTNIRYYCDEELKRLLNVAMLIRYGLKISKISKLSDAEMAEKVMNLSSDLSNVEGNIDNLIIAMVELDEHKFDKILARYIMSEGFENTVVKIIFPFFEKIGLLWQTGEINPAQEHFISNLIRQKFSVAIDNIMLKERDNPKKFVLFLPEGEYHELALMFYNYLIKKSGMTVYYLGSSVPVDGLVETNRLIGIDYLFTSFTTSLNRDEIFAYITDLAEVFPKQKIIVTGMQIKKGDFDFPSNIIEITSPQQFKEMLAEC